MKPLYSQIVSGFLLCLTVALPVRAADNAPTVDSILDKFVVASGGKAAMEKIKSRNVKGDLDLFGSASEWVMYAKAPNKQYAEFNHATMGMLADGFDGTVAWSKNQGGVRVKDGDELAKTKRDADFYRELYLKSLHPGLAYKGTDKVDGQDVHVLESKPTPSSKERFSFSTNSGLLVRQESELEGPQGKVNVNVRLGDFRVVDGIQYPYDLKFKVGAGGQEFDFTIKVKEVKHNVTIDDAKFAKPSE